MKAGRELDVLIGKKVLGLKVVKTVWGKEKQYRQFSIGAPDYYDDAGCSELHNPLPSYSQDIEAAWQVVEKLTSDSWKVTLITSEFGGTDCLIECTAGARGRFYSDTMEGLNTSAPLAICLAALKAKKVKTK